MSYKSLASDHNMHIIREDRSYDIRIKMQDMNSRVTLNISYDFNISYDSYLTKVKRVTYKQIKIKRYKLKSIFIILINSFMTK